MEFEKLCSPSCQTKTSFTTPNTLRETLLLPVSSSPPPPSIFNFLRMIYSWYWAAYEINFPNNKS
jgi:hypothetical protein